MDNHAPWGQPYEQETYPIWYPSDERMTNYPTNNTPSSSWNQPAFGTIDDMSIFESGLYQQQYDYYGDNMYMGANNYYGFEPKPVDPRLLSLLKFSRELYVRRKELCKKSFPKLHDEFVELSKKCGGVVPQVQIPHLQVNRMRSTPTLQRSLSVGSPRTPSNRGGESDLRLEWFRVRTLNVDGGGGGVVVQGDTTNPGGSKSK
ncbi:hypothetical protein SO802_009411 [Lithocarpus litseifolius]|uniref:Uncharacterized protein n=1 Tax=Lithocarpus litseifolius TaxID=425828 RepID=A0AAW2DCP6_9ROSI